MASGCGSELQTSHPCDQVCLVNPALGVSWRVHWDFWFHSVVVFPQRIILFRKATIVYIFILYQSPHKISQRERHLRTIKIESKTVLEKCGLWGQNAGILSSRNGHHAVHTTITTHWTQRYLADASITVFQHIQYNKSSAHYQKRNVNTKPTINSVYNVSYLQDTLEQWWHKVGVTSQWDGTHTQHCLGDQDKTTQKPRVK